jgi:hypothetical protein
MRTDLIATDTRYRKAVTLAADAARIMPVPGERAYLVPATQGGFYRVDDDGCPCPDAVAGREKSPSPARLQNRT